MSKSKASTKYSFWHKNCCNSFPWIQSNTSPYRTFVIYNTTDGPDQIQQTSL